MAHKITGICKKGGLKENWRLMELLGNTFDALFFFYFLFLRNTTNSSRNKITNLTGSVCISVLHEVKLYDVPCYLKRTSDNQMQSSDSSGNGPRR